MYTTLFFIKSFLSIIVFLQFLPARTRSIYASGRFVRMENNNSVHPILTAMFENVLRMFIRLKSLNCLTTFGLVISTKIRRSFNERKGLRDLSQTFDILVDLDIYG